MAGIKLYTGDFETTTIETNPDETWVWSWAVAEIGNHDNNYRKGTNITEFMNWCLSKESKKIYFHNLKFDGFFILDFLLRNGYKHNSERKSIQKTFQTIITTDGLFYEIKVCYKITGKNVSACTFQDSLKKLPFPVKRIAQAFKLPILKGDIDYKKVRPRGYQPTKEEWDYLENDVKIMAMALKIQLDAGLESMTIGSDSLTTFKHILNEEQSGQNPFKRFFPVLTEDMDDFIRQSYKGGFTYVNPKYANEPVESGQVYDVNSLYPSVMYDRDLPYGHPVHYTGEYEHNEEYPLFIQSFKCDFWLKEGHVPSLQIKGDMRYPGNQYLTDSQGFEPTLTLTSVDMKLFFDHYDVVVYEWIEGYMFQCINGQDIFKTYIDQFMEQKKREKGAKRELAKLLLNNLYGKFATSTDATRKIPTILNDKVKLLIGEDEVKESIYTAMGSFITSYARELTIRSAQMLGEDFIYADTDSLHIRGNKLPNIDIDPKELGKWKHEGDFVRGKFIRAKTYIEEICLNADGDECHLEDMVSTKTKVTCAGMNDKIKKQVDFDNFNLGQAFHGKLVPKVIKGGCVLVEDNFTLKV